MLKVSKDTRPGALNDANALGAVFCRRPLCEKCKGADFRGLSTGDVEEEIVWPTFQGIRASAGSCPLCALMVSVLPDEDSFEADDGRPIVLRGTKEKFVLEVCCPSKEAGDEDWEAELSSKLHLYAAADGEYRLHCCNNPLLTVAEPETGSADCFRFPRNAADPTIAKHWLSECLHSHEKCRASAKSLHQAKRPSRLIDVGSQDDARDPRLEEEAPSDSDYLTLSYCWGNPKTITKTTMETLEQFKQTIPLENLSQIFQDAVKLTRSLGIQYTWIDALCIVQDSSEDKMKELARMADIYAGSLLTISASRSTSGESSLFGSRNVYNAVPLPTTAAGGSSALSITNQVFHDFSADVPEGHLGSRGWCFQERLLAPRILHFGQDQCHWECHEGIWTESLGEKQWYDDFKAVDDGVLRETLFDISQAPFSQDWHGVIRGKLGEQANAELAEVWDGFVERLSQGLAPPPSDIQASFQRSLDLHDQWYDAVSAYTSRQLSFSGDKLPALSGVAVKFNSFLKDTYRAGI